MRRVILMLVLCGCASGGASPEGSDGHSQAPTIFTSAETGTLTADDPIAAKTTIAAPPAAVWSAVKTVYAQLEIPVTVENQAAHQIGNQNFYKSRNIGGEGMATLVNCGSGITGPKAASYRIYASLLTDVFPDGQGGTRLQTTFITAGQDMASGEAGDKITCATTGRLEEIVFTKVKEALAKSGSTD